MLAVWVFAAIYLIMLEFNSLYYSSPIYSFELYALQYIFQYAYSHICGSMVIASIYNSQSCDINKSLTSNIKQ